jgi:phosphatidylserine decarboxylase
METLFISFQALLPQQWLSRLIGKLAFVEHPLWLKNLLIRAFAYHYEVSLEEAEEDDLDDYPHFNAFFTRALKDEARPLAKVRFASPADGVLSQCGPIAEGQLIQAKGRQYSAAQLLASEDDARPFLAGSFATIYLSPRDYHRVHLPLDGTLRSTRYIPGDLFAVNKTTAERVDGLFARNERLVCLFDTAEGQVAVVLVGALIVAGIETVWGGVESPYPATIRERHFSPEHAPTFRAGDELGRFFLGSTVVVLTEQQDIVWAKAAGDTVRVKAALIDLDDRH